MQDYFGKSSLKQNVYKGQTGQRQKIELFLSPFVFFYSLLTFFSAHLPGTNNSLKQVTSPRGAFPAT